MQLLSFSKLPYGLQLRSHSTSLCMHFFHKRRCNFVIATIDVILRASVFNRNLRPICETHLDPRRLFFVATNEGIHRRNWCHERFHSPFIRRTKFIHLQEMIYRGHEHSSNTHLLHFFCSHSGMRKTYANPDSPECCSKLFSRSSTYRRS